MLYMNALFVVLISSSTLIYCLSPPPLLFFCPGLLCALWSVRVLPQSARWLLANDRREEAIALLRKAALVNGRVLPPAVQVWSLFFFFFCEILLCILIIARKSKFQTHQVSLLSLNVEHLVACFFVFLDVCYPNKSNFLHLMGTIRSTCIYTLRNVGSRFNLLKEHVIQDKNKFGDWQNFSQGHHQKLGFLLCVVLADFSCRCLLWMFNLGSFFPGIKKHAHLV